MEKEKAMFVDQEVSLKEVGQVVPKLSEAGIKSVAHHLKFKPIIVKELSKQNLLNVVLEELERRNVTEVCTLRSYNSDPVGIPKGTNAIDVNEFLHKHEEYIGEIEHPFTTSIYSKKIDTDVELLQSDVFKVNYNAVLNILMGKITQRIDLLRMICTNKACVTDNSFVQKSSLSDFDPSFEKFTDQRDLIIEKIRRALILATNRKVSVLELKIASDVAGILLSGDLKGYLMESRRKILEAYELPTELPRGYGGGDELDDEEYSLDLFKLPRKWKSTAILDDTRVYDLWNTLTAEVTKYEKLRLLDTDTILKAHIKVASLIKPQKDESNVIARRRDMQE